ncbi:MAG: MBL fold hydrolase [Clostridiales bacterium]|nr:MAG: MBL fold hydrolase [Clostridiales bacterium]
MKYKQIDTQGTNCYIIFSQTEEKVMLIDPAFEPDKILSACEGYKVDKILLTHGHIDHVYDCAFYGAPVYISKNDEEYLKNRSLSVPYNIFPELETRQYPLSGTFSDGDKINFCEYTFDVILTPGHTPGSCCFYTDGILFCGDLIFKGSIGRTDFPNGDEYAMAKSLLRVIQLPDETIICPGHGPQTTIKNEKYNNNYIEYYIRRYGNDNQ